MKDKTAIAICGAITSGKTTLAKKVAETTGFKRFSEENTGDYYKIIAQIDSAMNPKAIFDHCQLYIKIDSFIEQYDKVIFVLLEVKPNLLKGNFQTRLATNTTGDFRKLDPITHQISILTETDVMLKNISKPGKLVIIKYSIGKLSDYDKLFSKIIDKINRLL